MEPETTGLTRFVPMSEDEFAAFLEAAIPWFARDKVESGQWTEAESLILSRDGYAELLPVGIATPDHLLYALRDAATDTKVGMLWYVCQEQAGRKVAYVYDVLVYPEYQRLGHATRAFRLLEQEVRRRGMSGIALHVFGHNAGAKNLYEKLGFNATNINMFKAVGHSSLGGGLKNGEE
jgi:ribosomal protein S18 acetylase RimI-like enzyme